MANSLKGDGKAIFTIFVGLIIAIVFMSNIGDQIFTQTNTATATNVTATVSAINVSLAVDGRQLLVATSITNTTGTDITSEGLALATGIVNSAQTVILTANDSASALVGTEVNLTYTYNPDGFISNAGGRSIAALILIIASLALVIFVIVVLLKFGSLGVLTDMFKGRRKE